jgi:hypothetical protein
VKNSQTCLHLLISVYVVRHKGVIRTTNVTGSFADIGGILGRAMKGYYDDVWLLKVLVPIVSCFCLGSMIGQFCYDEFQEYSSIFNAVFMIIVSIAYVIAVKLTTGTELTYMELVSEKYTFPKVPEVSAQPKAEAGSKLARFGNSRVSSSSRDLLGEEDTKDEENEEAPNSESINTRLARDGNRSDQ